MNENEVINVVLNNNQIYDLVIYRINKKEEKEDGKCQR